MIQQHVFDLWGGRGEVSTTSSAMRDVRRVTGDVVDAVDRACSTFRDDSDISRVNRGTGDWVHVSSLFLEVLSACLDMASATDGAVDPTVGLATIPSAVDVRVGADRRGADWRSVEVGPNRVRIPTSVRLDLGACAKGWCADTAAHRSAEATGAPVLVGLCGDISVAGSLPDREGWDIVCGDDHQQQEWDAAEPASSVTIRDGGLATSSVSVRRRGGRSHIVDPTTLAPVAGRWRTVSVAAANCLQANAAATASIVRDEAALDWLRHRELPARLVARDGSVVTTGGWPS